MTIGTNTSPLVGRTPGAKVTARLVRDRLGRELVGNVSLDVLPTERPDTWRVRGRGELALAVLVETMRREGYELTVGPPPSRARWTAPSSSRWSGCRWTCPRSTWAR